MHPRKYPYAGASCSSSRARTSRPARPNSLSMRLNLRPGCARWAGLSPSPDIPPAWCESPPTQSGTANGADTGCPWHFYRTLRHEDADTEKIGRHELLSTPTPLDRSDAVEDATRQVGEQRALPLTGTIHIGRHVNRIFRRRSFGPDHRRNQKYFLPIALEVDPPQGVHRREAINLPRRRATIATPINPASKSAHYV
jgi:hypothetical protein